LATDIQKIIDNLTAFYNFTGKNVIHVGAGGGQIIGYAHLAKSVLAVDTDAEAIEHLKDAVRSSDLSGIFTVEHRDFMELNGSADVVFFEFCLHEMAEPYKALSKASGLASDVVVLDHDKDSSWSWYACETDKLKKSWDSVIRFKVAREQTFQAIQRFETYTELFDKFSILGKEALDRIKVFDNEQNIEIDMNYKTALITLTVP
jgi:ubiquinone/menaquinone biosynthesis C-methylase UbiE